jgi:UDP-N-acetylmuramate dehydrogenase
MSVDFKNWFRQNASRFSGPLLFDEFLSKYTYYKIGGPAAVFAVPKSKEDLRLLAEGIQATQPDFFILGLGSNILASDQGYAGLIIRTSRLNLEIEALSETRIRVGSSVANSSLLRRVSQEGWAGLEFLTGIPGSVGGAVKMNAGTHLGETQSKLRRVEVYSLTGASSESVIFEGNQLQFQYRKNLFLPPGNLVWSVEWEIQKTEPSVVKSLIDETLARRKATQPVEHPSCGSVFKNPRSSGVSSWQVIDGLKLRGYRIGDAQFSEKHSNFIINCGHAKASDVRSLIEVAKERAQNEMGIELEEEVIYLGA